MDVRIGFGEYVEVDAMQKHRNDATKPRTFPAISLDPKGNLQGSVRFFVLTDPQISFDKSGKKEKLAYSFCTRDRWVKMVTSQVVIDRMNMLAYDNRTVYPPADLTDMDKEEEIAMSEEAAEEIREPAVGITGENHVPVEEVEDVIPDDFPVVDEDHDMPFGQLQRSMPLPPSLIPREQEQQDLPGEVEVPIVSDELLTTAEPVNEVLSPGVAEMPGVQNDVVEDAEPPAAVVVPPMPTRVSARTTKSRAPSRYSPDDYGKTNINLTMIYRIFHISLKKGLQKYGKAAKVAASAELGQMIERMVWSMVESEELFKIDWSKVIHSFMFLKEKFKPDGTFDKLKMRLVAGGNFQNRLDYDDISSPTVLLTTVLTVVVIAVKKKYFVVTADVAGAFLNAILKNKNLYMRLDPTLAAILVEMDSSYRNYLLKDGSLIVKLEKALYGCIESAKLWYELLAKTLMEYGLIQSSYDPCLFFSQSRDMYVTIYVDDILIAAEMEADARNLLKFLQKKFKNITLNEGSIISYLGMNFHLDYDNGQVKVTMDKYIEDVLQVCGVAGNSKTPALSDLFYVDLNSPPLLPDDKEHFHSMVAKLLYLAKRVRPDILTAISFLATRVKEPTEQDRFKLERVCKYIRCTKDECIILKAHEEVVAYVDASHAVHSKDGRSHTGVYVTLGAGPVFVRSTKQKLTTKSSTEAELVALSDALPMILWIREMLIELGYMRENQAIKVMEDNMSTIALVKRGRPGSESTRHINIRFFFISDRVRIGHVAIEYCETEMMVADYFTKALVGTAHHEMAKLMMNSPEGIKTTATRSKRPGVFEEK